MNSFTVKLKIRNAAGEVVGEREVPSYAGLLARAHEQGLDHIETHLVEAPSEQNGHTAIVTALVRGERGSFTGIGDANPGNVHPRASRHLIRLAETRAKARALRDYTNIGTVALEELVDETDLTEEPADRPGPRRPLPRVVGSAGGERSGGERSGSERSGGERSGGERSGGERSGGERSGVERPSFGSDRSVTEAQRRMLWRLAARHGYQGPEARAFLWARLDLEAAAEPSRLQASRLIDTLKAELGSDEPEQLSVA